MLKIIITSITILRFTLCIRKQRSNNSILNWKKKGLDNFRVLFNNEFSSMSKYRSNNILAFKFSPDKIGEPIDLDSSMRVNLPDKGNPSSRNRQLKMSISTNVFVEAELFGQMPKSLPEMIPEHPGESCAMFFVSKPPVWFLIMVIVHESLAGSSKRGYCRAFMPLKDSFLPEGIKAFNRGVSSRLSLWYEYQMYPQKQMKPDNLGYAVLIPSSTGSGHLVVHLGDLRNPHILPCINQMLTQGDSLLIIKLACKDRMTCHIHGVEGIESCNPSWASEIAGANKVCLVEISHLLCLEIWIGLITAVSFWFSLARLAMFREYSGYGGDRRHIINPSLLKLPVNNLWTNTGESGSTSLMSFKFIPNRKNLFNHTVRCLSPELLWCTALIPETINSLLFISSEPFGKPVITPLDQLNDFIKSISMLIQLYCFVALLKFFVEEV